MTAIQKQMEEKFKQFEAVRLLAESENRNLTAAERAKRAELKKEIEALGGQRADDADEKELRSKLYGSDEECGGPLTLGDLEPDRLGNARISRSTPKEYELRGPKDKKDYRSLFGTRNGYDWTDKTCSFFDAVFSGRHHPGLITRGMTEGVGSDGGILVPTQYADQIHAVSLENEIIMPRCFLQPMTTNECKIPAFAIGSHFASLFGGFIASYKAETAELEEKNPKIRQMLLVAKKLTGLLRFSNELASDTPGGVSRIVEICGKGLAWYRDRAFLKGNGAGEPLGILNANCTIAIEIESGQKPDTIVYPNLTKMMSRMYAGGFGNSIWIVHQSCIPQLLELVIPVGTGGTYIPVMRQADGGFEILTRPVIFTEKTETLGSKGDIMLCDLSQYVTGLREGMRFDLSPHKYFTTDELLARLIERHDGQPLWNEPLTLEDGQTTVSPFVTLAERK